MAGPSSQAAEDGINLSVLPTDPAATNTSDVLPTTRPILRERNKKVSNTRRAMRKWNPRTLTVMVTLSLIHI